MKIEPVGLVAHSGGRGKANLSEFEAGLVYRVSSKTARAVSKRKQTMKIVISNLVHLGSHFSLPPPVM